MVVQARSLIWSDLSAEQLQSLRAAPGKKTLSPREQLAKFLGIKDPTAPRSAIELDLYMQTLKFGQVQQGGWPMPRHSALHAYLRNLHLALPSMASLWFTCTLHVHPLTLPLQGLGLPDDKLSALFSIVKRVHRDSVQGRMPVMRSFALLKARKRGGGGSCELGSAAFGGRVCIDLPSPPHGGCHATGAQSSRSP